MGQNPAWWPRGVSKETKAQVSDHMVRPSKVSRQIGSLLGLAKKGASNRTEELGKWASTKMGMGPREQPGLDTFGPL
jgi:hypothetical protein